MTTRLTPSLQDPQRSVTRWPDCDDIAQACEELALTTLCGTLTRCINARLDVIG